MAISARAEAILGYWNDLGPAGWYAGSAEIDDEVRRRFLSDWTEAHAGGLRPWLTCSDGILAYLLLTDQFPRNMFRDQGRAFATDPLARQVATFAWQKKADLGIEPPLRQFFYLPLMHSESQTDQDRCVRLMLTRIPETGKDNLRHAKAHREVIRRFGRFPYRNEALARKDTPLEEAFVRDGGYGSVLREMSA